MMPLGQAAQLAFETVKLACKAAGEEIENIFDD